MMSSNDRKRSVFRFGGFAIAVAASVLVFQNCGEFSALEPSSFSSSGDESAIFDESVMSLAVAEGLSKSCDSRLKKVSITLSSGAPLRCNSTGVNRSIQLANVVINRKFLKDNGIDDSYLPGRAVAFARLKFTNTHNAVTYYWAANVDVGNHNIDGYSSLSTLGDDICPGTSTVRSIIGAGKLTGIDAKMSTANRVVINANHGANPCVDGTVQFAGGTLDIYIAKEACAGTQIRFASMNHQNPKGFVWPTSLATGATIEPSAAMRTSGETRILLSAEGTTPEYPGGPGNKCGAEVATVAWGVNANGKRLVTNTTLVPASMGQSHVVVSHLMDVPASELSNGKIELLLGRNYGVDTFTGKYPSYPNGIGNGFMAALHLGPPPTSPTNPLPATPTTPVAQNETPASPAVTVIQAVRSAKVGEVESRGSSNDPGSSFLFRTASATITPKYDGVSVTSCQSYGFATGTGTYSVRVRRVQAVKNESGTVLDSCTAPTCNTDPGTQVFESKDKISWTRLGSIDAGTATAGTVFTPQLTGARYLMVCRGGGGHGRDNIEVVAVTRRSQ